MRTVLWVALFIMAGAREVVGQPVHVALEQSFPLKTSLIDGVIQDFRVQGNRVVALAANRDSSEVIMATIGAGPTESKVLPGRREFLAVLPNGTVVTSRNRTDSHLLTTLSSDASRSWSERPFPILLSGLFALSGSIYGWGPTGVWAYPDQGTEVALRTGQSQVPLGEPSLATELTSTSIAVVSVMKNPTLTVIGRDGTVLGVTSLTSPLLARRTAELEPEEGSIGVIAADASRGRLYCLVSGFSPRTGMTVEEFDRHGQYVRSLSLAFSSYPDLVIPTSTERSLPANPSGGFFPRRMRATEEKLFVAHGRPGHVLAYRIP